PGLSLACLWLVAGLFWLVPGLPLTCSGRPIEPPRQRNSVVMVQLSGEAAIAGGHGGASCWVFRPKNLRKRHEVRSKMGDASLVFTHIEILQNASQANI